MKKNKNYKGKQNEEKGSSEDEHNNNFKILTNKNEKEPKAPFPGFGICCTFISGLFYALNTLFAKLATSIHPVQLGVMRCYIQFMLLLPLLQYKCRTIDITGPKGKKIYLCLRGLLGSSAMLFLYLSFEHLSLGNAVTITFLTTITTPIIARIFLKESLTVLDCVFAVLSLCGVVLIAQPPFLFPNLNGEASQSAIGVFYASTCALLMSSAHTVIRKLGKETYFVLNVFYYSFMGSITTTILLMALNNFQLPCSSHLFYIVSVGVSGVLAQGFLTLALQWERAGTVGILRTFQIILVYIFQVVILKDIPSMFSLMGAALIFSSSVGIGVRKIVNEKRRFSLRKQSVVVDN